tara:strand:+ start:195 stop:377 length:183 start_codon:yes stop_codon:yes gene_type:complete
MTPFELAEKNVMQLAIRLNLYALMIQTVKDTEGIDPDDADQVWKVILTMFEASDLLGESN